MPFVKWSLFGAFFCTDICYGSHCHSSKFFSSLLRFGGSRSSLVNVMPSTCRLDVAYTKTQYGRKTMCFYNSRRKEGLDCIRV